MLDGKLLMAAVASLSSTAAVRVGQHCSTFRRVGTFRSKLHLAGARCHSTAYSKPSKPCLGFVTNPALRLGRNRKNLQVRMVLTESVELAIGTKAPDFELPEPLTGKTVSLSSYQGAPALIVIFMCNHCPFVILLKEALVSFAKDYEAKGVKVVAISANSIKTHPQDGPDAMAADARKLGYPFAYLYDERQEVAEAYRAACTPEFYVFDHQLLLRYHGQFDDARPSNGITPTGKDLRDAVDAVLTGQPIPRMKRSIGCNIKWHPGNEPAYYGSR